MRVVVNEDMKVFHGHVPVELKKGQEVSGDLAEMLLAGARRKVTRVDTELASDRAVDDLDIAGTIEQVLEWVGTDPERALQAHEAEEARGDKARSTLLAKLADIGLDDGAARDA